MKLWEIITIVRCSHNYEKVAIVTYKVEILRYEVAIVTIEFAITVQEIRSQSQKNFLKLHITKMHNWEKVTIVRYKITTMQKSIYKVAILR